MIGDSSKSDNAALLDLFQEEVRGNLEILNEGLIALEASPSEVQRIERLMRAAHSIKGALSMVTMYLGQGDGSALAAAVPVAHALEECLVRAQNGRLLLTSADVDVLLEAVDLLGRMAEVVGPGLALWFADNGATVAEVRERLLALAEGTHAAVKAEPSPPATQVETKSVPSVGHTTQDGETDEDESIAADASREPLLELFRTEMTAHGRTLRDGLDRLVNGPWDNKALEPMLRAARWARSAAHIVHIASAARLAQAVEDRLMAMQHNRQPPSAADVSPLRQAAELLPVLGEAAVTAEFATWLTQQKEPLRELLGRLRVPAARMPSQADTTPNLLVPTPAASLAETPSPVSEIRAPTRATPAPAREAEQVVRVTAQSLTRLMGLAGEALVQARWLQPFANLLLRLKRQQSRLGEALDELGQALPSGRSGDAGRHALGEVREGLAACHSELSDRIGEFEDHARGADNLNSRLYREVIASRMRPFGDGTHGFPRLTRDLARKLGKKVRFDVIGETTEVDRDILEKLEAPLNHLLRNALDHGLETPEERTASGKSDTGTLCLEARHNAGTLSIQVRDDGRGIALDRIRRKVIDRKLAPPEMAVGLRDEELLEFLFLPGFSTAERVTEVSGRGVGLDVVRSMVTAVGGTVRIQSQPGRGTTFHLQLPLTLSVIRAVLTEIAGEPYAFPHNRINRLLRLPRSELASLQDRQFFEVDGRNVGVVLARQVFNLAGEVAENDDLFVILFGEGAQEYGLVVDRFLGEQDLVVRPLDDRLGRVPNLSAAAILEDGAPVLIVDIDDLGRSIGKLLQGGRLKRADRPDREQRLRKRVLVVDDSITVREVERQLLVGRGYEVEVAVDGMDGWRMAREGRFDLVITDVDMPRMDGLGLVRCIKNDTRLQSIPVVIVSYKDQKEHRLAGLEAGANYYLTKSSFHDETLLHAVRDLIGEPDS